MQMTSRPANAIVQPLPGSAEVLWRAVREEAEALLRVSPELGGLVVPTVFHASSIADATARRISVRLAGAALPDRLLYDGFSEAFAVDPAIAAAVSADSKAVLDRDPATTRAIEPLLYFKGSTPSRPIVWRTGCGRAAGATSRSICRAGRRKCSRPTSTRRCRWARACFSIMPPASWSARRR